MSTTLFTRIRDREIPADIVFEDDDLLAFRDVNPQAPVHILVVPKTVIPNCNELDESQSELVGRMVLVARDLARSEGVADSGYRLVFNINEDGGQTVDHLHLHIIGGRTMEWPPG